MKITKGDAEAFWNRFDAALENNNYLSLKDYCKEVDLGVSYQGILWKRCNGIMPTLETTMIMSRTLGVSIDFLVFGYVRGAMPVSDEEMGVLTKYREANSTTKAVIDRLLN